MSTHIKRLRLGVNIDHVATLRNARGGFHPDPIRAALLAKQAGADGITAHLREDRRHIRDEDIKRLREEVELPLNFEMAATEEMLKIAGKIRPHAVCLVPEKREEVTTEGGLDVVKTQSRLISFIQHIKESGARVSLFIEADSRQMDAAKLVGADIVEIHTGAYCHETGKKREAELTRITEATKYAHSLGLEVHAGHGLNYETVEAIAAIPEIVELNIGHFLMGEALFLGLEGSIREMRRLMNKGRKG
ncbi:MAG: pyridoxine 5-phosphate synthase [Rickettsiales bacterium]|jgi:pyridoxine 5-phosphate synthase|nr:pyridoxine 5-phosphate synthase [Rickettsiales bacterium]